MFTRTCYICISKYLKKGHNSVRKGRIKKSNLYTPSTIGDNPRICYICISKYLKIGHNSVRKGRRANSSLHAQLCTIGDNPRRFQDHPLKAVRGRIC